MFISKNRPIVISQYEHGRLAGTFASAWGNEAFEKPALDFQAFVQGVALHDWHYGVTDNTPIGGASEEEWLAVVTRGVQHWFEHPVTDIVAKLHIRRLLSGNVTLAKAGLIDQIEQRVSERLAETAFTRRQFDWADTITRFCDFLAFDFSFEAPVEKTAGVFARPDDEQETQLSYQVLPGGKVSVHPWPFSVDSLSGILIGYQQAGYPEKLVPEIVPFSVNKGAV